MNKASLLLSIFVVATSATLHAQPGPAEGDRIRVTLSGGEQLIGIVGPPSDDSLTLVTDRGAEALTISTSGVADIERSLGHRRDAGKYVGISAAVGAVVGLAVGMSMDLCVSDGWFDCFMEPTTRRGAVTLGVIGGGMAGVIPGALIGFTQKKEVWEPVSVPTRASTGLSVYPIVGERVGFVASWTPGRD